MRSEPSAWSRPINSAPRAAASASMSWARRRRSGSGRGADEGKSIFTTEHTFYTGGERIRGVGCITAALVGAALAVAGCGGSSASTTQATATSPELSGEQLISVTDWSATAASYCMNRKAGIGDAFATRKAVEGLIAVARQNPEARYVIQGRTATDGTTVPSESRTMRQVLSDAASDLEPCAPALADRLDRAVGTLP